MTERLHESTLAPGLHHASDLAQRGPDVEVMNHAEAADEIEAAWLQLERLGIHDAEVDQIRDPLGRRLLPGALDRDRREVDRCHSMAAGSGMKRGVCALHAAVIKSTLSRGSASSASLKYLSWPG